MEKCGYRISLASRMVLLFLLVVTINILISVRWTLHCLNRSIRNHQSVYLVLFQPIVVPRVNSIAETFLNQTQQEQGQQQLVFHTHPMTAENFLNVTTVFFSTNDSAEIVEDTELETYSSQTSDENIGTKIEQESRINFTNNNQTAYKTNGTTSIAPESLLPNATFAACLLIRDDNDILSEWIAYHYHTIRMRNLVVAIDPLSKEQPDSILDEWSIYTDMTILQWSDSDYMPKQFLQTKRPPDQYLVNDTAMEDRIEISNHRYRQRIFLSACMKHFRIERNSTWLMHVDTDEFIVPFDEDKPLITKVKKQRTRRHRNKNRDLSVSSSTTQMPLASIPGSTLHYIQNNLRRNNSVVRYPCIAMPRRLFGSTERQYDTTSTISTDEEQLDQMKFETLRWSYHVPLQTNKNPARKDTKQSRMLGNRSGMWNNGYPKVILDISAIPERYFTNQFEPVFSIHRPFLDLCPRSTEVFTNAIDQDSNMENSPTTRRRKQRKPVVPFLGVNHYLGSWERYSRKDDKRRSKIVYDYKNQQATTINMYDNDIQPWLDGFIKSVSQETASQLLRNYR